MHADTLHESYGDPKLATPRRTVSKFERCKLHGHCILAPAQRAQSQRTEYIAHEPDICIVCHVSTCATNRSACRIQSSLRSQDDRHKVVTCCVWPKPISRWANIQANISMQMQSTSGRAQGPRGVGAAAAAVARAPHLVSDAAERVEEVKARLATLFTREAELDVELSELHSLHLTHLQEQLTGLESARERLAAKRGAVRVTIHALESELDGASAVSGGHDPIESLAEDRSVAEQRACKMRELQAGVESTDAAVKRVAAMCEAVRAEIKAVEIELDAAVNAPVIGGQDPTEWLPDELLLMVLERVPFAMLWRGVCKRVCRRWDRLMKSAAIVRRMRDGRWAAYKSREIKPQRLLGHTRYASALAVAPDSMLCSGSYDTTIRVWSCKSGAHVQTLRGHTRSVRALAVGPNGKIYSGSYDKKICVWSSASGTHLQTLVGHVDWVLALAVGRDGKVYSGCQDATVRAWSGDDGSHLQTLVGHTRGVSALAVGKDGTIYSGSIDRTIRAWSGVNGTRLRMLVGHEDAVLSLAVGLDGRVYSGSGDKTIRVWSPVDGALLQTLEGHSLSVMALAVAPDGKVFSGSNDGTIRVWSGDKGSHLHTINACDRVLALAVGENGTLFACGDVDSFMLMWR
jgi:hypothetical protein